MHWACSPYSRFALSLPLPLGSLEPSGTVWRMDVLALPASSSKDTVNMSLSKHQWVLGKERCFALRFELFRYKPESPNNRLTGLRKEVEPDRGLTATI